MRLAARVARLERAKGAGCPACGHGGPGPLVFNVLPPKVLRPGWTMQDLEDDARVRPEDFCPSCGHKRVLRIPSPFLSRGRE